MDLAVLTLSMERPHAFLAYPVSARLLDLEQGR
jgi:hypothetical protein